jgi:hypothetical protein
MPYTNDPEAQRRRAARMMLGITNINQATPEQLYKLESFHGGKGSSGALKNQDKRRKRALAAYALRSGAKPQGRTTGDLIEGKTGRARKGVDPALAAFLEKRRKKPFKNPGKPYRA